MRAEISSITSLCKLIAKNIPTKYQRLGTFCLLHYKKRTILNLAFIAVGVVVGWRAATDDRNIIVTEKLFRRLFVTNLELLGSSNMVFCQFFFPGLINST